jgi:hypothetical protein
MVKANLETGMKVCGHCKQEKPLSDFNYDGSMTDGLCNDCRECQKERSREYYKTHKEQKKQYAIEHKEEKRAYHKKYHIEHREEKLKYGKNYRRKNE